ncbi:hypothetical protein HDU92_004786 [Lobulomyces angularis]|nr:hypothetical protein HDU92_004786 [Lobulomyces angularis]
MTTKPIFIIGGTGRVGRQVLEQLLSNGNEVKALVRSKESEVLKDFLNNPKLTVIEEKDLLSLSTEDFSKLIQDVETIICTLGHTSVSAKPKTLVVDTTKLIHKSVEHLKPSVPVKLLMLGTSGILNPADDRKMVKYLVAPVQDSQECVDYIANTITKDNQYLQWTIVRPVNFVEKYEDGITEYKTFEKTIHPFYNNGVVKIKNIADFFVNLAKNNELFDTWKGKMPVIVDSDQALYKN